MSEHVNNVFEFSALDLVSLQVDDEHVLFGDTLAECFDFSGADDDDFLELEDLFLKSGDGSSGSTELAEFKSESLEGLFSFLEESGESLDLLVQVVDLTLEDFDLSVGGFELVNAESELRDFLFLRGDLAAHEFDLLCEVDELFFEGLLVSEGHVEVTFALGSLDGFVVKVAREFFDLSDEEEAVLLGFSEFSFELLDLDQEEVVFSGASLEFFDFLEFLVQDQSELFEFALEGGDLLFELSLDGLELLDLDGELVDLEGELSDFLVSLVEGGLELLDGSHEVFNAGLVSVDFGFVLAAADFEHAQLVDELVLLEELVSELFDRAFLHEQVLLEVGDLLAEGLDFSAFADQVFEFSSGEHDADCEVLVLVLEQLDLCVTLGQHDLEFVQLHLEVAELLEESLTFLEQVLVLSIDFFLSALHVLEFLSGGHLEQFEFAAESVQFIVVFDVHDLFDLLWGSTSQFDQFFSQSLVVSFQTSRKK